MPLHPSSLLAAALLCGLAAGCVHVPTSVKIDPGHLRAATAGLVGCPAEEIAVSGFPAEVRPGDAPLTWRAECRGHRFQCSHGGGEGDSARCAEELAPRP